MAGKIDWLYHRKRCTTCKKARGYLEEKDIRAADEADAAKDRRGKEEALELAKSASKVIVARGAKVVTFDMRRDPPDDATLLAHLLGPTGNLRAPTIRKGKTLLIGFNDSAYDEVLGG